MKIRIQDADFETEAESIDEAQQILAEMAANGFLELTVEDVETGKEYEVWIDITIKEQTSSSIEADTEGGDE